MPEATEFAFEETVAVAGFLGETGGDQAVEGLAFQEFGRRALQGIPFALPFPRCTVMVPAQLRFPFFLAERSIQYGDGGQAEITPFESRDTSHKLHYIQNETFLRSSRKNGISLSRI